ncbi:Integrase [Flavobacterium longum]
MLQNQIKKAYFYASIYAKIMKWTAKIIKHRGERRIAVTFEKTPWNIDKMRDFPGSAWSNSLKVWHLPASPDNLRIFNLQTEFTPQRLEVERFRQWLRSRRYSENTVRTYCEALMTFLKFFGDMPTSDMTDDDVVYFNNEYVLKNKFSASYQNQVVNAIKLYFQTIENRKIDIGKIHRPKNPKNLPNVLSKSEIKEILSCQANIKHRAMLSMIYSCGLRRSELLALKPQDINADRQVVLIRQAKGRKDRIAPLSPKILTLLREYYRYYRPEIYLFEGRTPGEPYDARSLSEVLRVAVTKAGIDKPVTLHWLRHSYATHLLESGTDLRYIQEILGHNSSRTTEIYTHVSTRSIQMVKSPFDDL